MQAITCLMNVVHAVARTRNVQLFHVCVHVLAGSMLELDQLEEVEALMLFVLQWGRRHADMIKMRACHGFRSAMIPADLICWMIAKFPSCSWEPWQVISAAYLRAGLVDHAIATASLVQPAPTQAYVQTRVTIAEARFQKGDLQVLNHSLCWTAFARVWCTQTRRAGQHTMDTAMQGAEAACTALHKQKQPFTEVHAHVIFLTARLHAYHGHWQQARMTLDGFDDSFYAECEPALCARILHLKSRCANKLGQGDAARDLLHASALVRFWLRVHPLASDCLTHDHVHRL